MYVAIPALQAMSYAIDSESLRDLYANLLAKAMNTHTKNDVHPGLVETIKQMSPHDATYFKLLAPIKEYAIVDVRGIYKDASFDTLQENRNLFSVGYDYKNMNLSISNLIRLGLITIPVNTYIVSEDAEKEYNRLIESLKPEYNIKNYPRYVSIDFIQKLIQITAYGAMFYEICVKD